MDNRQSGSRGEQNIPTNEIKKWLSNPQLITLMTGLFQLTGSNPPKSLIRYELQGYLLQ